MKLLISTGLLLVSFTVSAADIACNSETEICGENTPDGKELWCAKKSSECSFMDGEYKFWHPNRVLGQTGFYRKSKMHGTWKVWDSRGNLESVSKYKDGLKISEEKKEAK